MTTKTEFDQIFEELETSNYPASSPEPHFTSKKEVVNRLNNHASLVAALERVRKMSQYIVDMSDQTTLYCAKMQAEQVIVEVNVALSRVRE